MARLVTVVLILAVVSCVVAAPCEVRGKETGSSYKASPSRGSIQHIKSTFGEGSFSYAHGGKSTSTGTGGKGGTVGNVTYGDQGERRYPSYASPSGGSIGVGHIENSSFGEGSFSYAHGGKSTGPGTGGKGGSVGPITYGDQTSYP